MKKGLVIVFILSLFIAACADKEKQNAVTYNDAVVKSVDKADSVVKILFAFEMFDKFPQVEQSFNAVFSESLEQLNKIQPFPEDDKLRKTAIELVEKYQSILNDDFKGIYEIMHDSVYTAIDSVRVDSLMSEMYTKWQFQSSNIATEQNEFAKRHQIQLGK